MVLEFFQGLVIKFFPGGGSVFFFGGGGRYILKLAFSHDKVLPCILKNAQNCSSKKNRENPRT